MNEELKQAEYELSCLLDSLAHLKAANRTLNFSYNSAVEPRKQGEEFSDVTYALGALQQHVSTIDTLIERSIAALRHQIFEIKRDAKLAE